MTQYVGARAKYQNTRRLCGRSFFLAPSLSGHGEKRWEQTRHIGALRILTHAGGFITARSLRDPFPIHKYPLFRQPSH